MLKRLLYPFRINFFILLISIFSLLPFIFLIIAENVTVGAVVGSYSNVESRCLFESAGYEIEKIEDINSFVDESSKAIKSFSGEKYSHTDYVIFSPVFTEIDGFYSRTELFFSNNAKSLKQYMTMVYSFDFDIDNDNHLFAASSSIGLDEGNEIKLYNNGDKEIFETFEITNVFKGEQNDNKIFCVSDSLTEKMLNIMDHPSIDFIHYHNSSIDANFTNRVTIALSKEFESKNRKISEKTEGYDIVFGEGKLIVSVVSILVSIVLFYAFSRKEFINNKNELTYRYFYQSRFKNYLIHIGKDLLIAISSYFVCLSFIAISALILNANGVAFIFDTLCLLVFAAHFVITFFESTFSYLYYHYFKKVD